MDQPAEEYDWVECEFCHNVQHIDNAIDEGWISEFYKGDVAFGPACPRCVERFLQRAEDGEYVLR